MSEKNRPEVVVVTGASAGIGRATACAFARQNARIGLLARGRAGLEGAKQDVESLGGSAIILPSDVADANQIERAAETIEKEFGPIDIWVNNAFCSVFSPVKQMTAGDYRRVTEVTYLGFVHGTLAALRRMLARNRGTIVQVGSALAYRGIPLQSAYCAAKHAIQGFTESVRCELIHDGSNVKITMVQMPALNTPQFTWSKSRMPQKAQPVPPIYQPEVAADAIVWAAHHYRREWYVGVSTTAAILGNKLAPSLGDYFLAWQGYQSQMHDSPDDPNRPNNLYEPVDEDRDYGSHGEFDDQSYSRSTQLWIDQRRHWIALAGLGGVLLGALRDGLWNSWRGGLLGLAVGALGSMGHAALTAGIGASAEALPMERRTRRSGDRPSEKLHLGSAVSR